MTTETKTKIKEAIKILNIALNQIESNKNQAKINFENNSFKFLRKTTIDFYNDLLLKFGENWIDRNDNMITFLERKLFIKDVADVLKSLQKKGKCEIIYNDVTFGIGRKRIVKFRLIK